MDAVPIYVLRQVTLHIAYKCCGGHPISVIDIEKKLDTSPKV